MAQHHSSEPHAGTDTPSVTSEASGERSGIGPSASVIGGFVSESRVRVALSGDHLVRSGIPWFLLGDTIWSALTHISADEWPDYLRQRRGQGFNALNISVLPILHDMSDAPRLPSPFVGFWEGAPRFGALDAEYVTRATTMLEAAVDAGFVPVLVLVWCDYAPDTSASRQDERYVMPADALPDYLGSVVEAFDRFDPIYILSGDTDFPTAATTAFYTRAAAELRLLVPEALTSFHTSDKVTLPRSLADLPGSSFYGYQSGHRLTHQNNAYDYAEHYRAQPTTRPIINLEPCYEGIKHGFGQGRFDAADVRQATWQSLLAGASAGIGYGAHGVWQWHRRGSRFSDPETLGIPFDRMDALRFDGAWDVGMARRLVDQFGLHGMVSRQDLLLPSPRPKVRVASSRDGTCLVVYAPYSDEISLALTELPRDSLRWDLARRRVAEPDLALREDRLVIGLPEHPTDSLIILWPEDHQPVG